MEPATTMAIASTAAQGIGMGIDASGRKKSQKRQYEYQKKLNEQQHQRALDMWNKTNYPEQVKKLKEAGLNPALIYGGAGEGGTVGGGTAGSAPSEGQGYGASNIGMGIQEAQLMEAQKKNIEADTEKKKAEELELKGETDESRARINSILKGMEGTDAEIALKKVQTSLGKLEESMTEEASHWTLEQIKWESQKAYKELGIAEDEAYMSRETREEKIKIINETAIQAILKSAQDKENINLTREQIKKIGEDIAQGWEGLSQNDEKIAIQKATEVIKANNPGMGQVTGRFINDTIEAVWKMAGKSRPTRDINWEYHKNK